MDIAAPALLLGQAIGRLGNFVNQELYGPPTTLCGVEFPPCLPWGIQIDATHRGETAWDAITFPVETTTFVPLFAYEAILNLIGMAVLLFVIRRFGPRLFAGDAVLMYIMWYGAVRTAARDISRQQLDHPRAADGDVAGHHRLRPGAGLADHPPPARMGLADDPARRRARDRCARAAGAGGALRWLTGRASCPM